MLRGIDVSTYQGAIDWTAAAGSGLAFAFVRFGDGLGHDPTWERNRRDALAAGLAVGTYQFFRASKGGEAQARELVAKIGTLGPGELAPVVDVESGWPGASRDDFVRELDEWIAIVGDGLGCTPIVYTGPYFWRSMIGDLPPFEVCPLWIADYRDRPEPEIPKPWTRWTWWQTTDKGSVPGIKGPVDLDVFNGDANDLAWLAAKPIGGVYRV